MKETKVKGNPGINISADLRGGGGDKITPKVGFKKYEKKNRHLKISLLQ
jgi:hypothetical protein